MLSSFIPMKLLGDPTSAQNPLIRRSIRDNENFET